MFPREHSLAFSRGGRAEVARLASVQLRSIPVGSLLTFRFDSCWRPAGSPMAAYRLCERRYLVSGSSCLSNGVIIINQAGVGFLEVGVQLRPIDVTLERSDPSAASPNV